MGGLLSAVTGITGGLKGISGRRLLQSPPPPVTDQVVAAVTDGGNTVLGGVSGLLNTLELVPPPPAMHLLQETPPPATGDAQLVNMVGAMPVLPPWHLCASQVACRTVIPCCMPLAESPAAQPLHLHQKPLSSTAAAAPDTLHLCCRPRRLCRAMWGDC